MSSNDALVKDAVVIVAGLFALFGGGLFVYKKTRGLRNNNPGNIRKGADWVGLAEKQPDPEFATFTDPVYGIRAINRILRTYYKVHGLNTVRGIITRWAPPTENDTESYVQSVAGFLGVDPDEPIDVEAYAAQLTAAIIRHENGVQPYSWALLDRGANMGWA